MIYYIHTTDGFDGNSGTDEYKPFLSWAKALNVMGRGDTLKQLFDYTYDEVRENTMSEEKIWPNIYFIDTDHGKDGLGLGAEGTDINPFKTFGYAKGAMMPGDRLVDITQRQVYTFEAVQDRVAPLKRGGALMEIQREEKFLVRGDFTENQIKENIHKKQDLVVAQVRRIANQLWEVTVLRQLCDMPDTFKGQSGS